VSPLFPQPKPHAQQPSVLSVSRTGPRVGKESAPENNDHLRNGLEDPRFTPSAGSMRAPARSGRDGVSRGFNPPSGRRWPGWIGRLTLCACAPLLLAACSAGNSSENASTGTQVGASVPAGAGPTLGISVDVAKHAYEGFFQNITWSRGQDSPQYGTNTVGTTSVCIVQILGSPAVMQTGMSCTIPADQSQAQLALTGLEGATVFAEKSAYSALAWVTVQLTNLMGAPTGSMATTDQKKTFGNVRIELQSTSATGTDTVFLTITPT